MKDKPNGENGAPVVDHADSAEDAVRDEALGASKRRPSDSADLEAPPDQGDAAPAEPNSTDTPDELAPQNEDLTHRDLALPAPGLPDEPSFTGEPFISAVEAPDGEPAVGAALAWQPEVAPDLGPQSDPLLVDADDADPAEPLQISPDVEPAREDADAHPSTDEPPGDPAALTESPTGEPPQHEPLAAQEPSEPSWAEEDPAAVPILEALGEAPWPEQTPSELPTDEPAAAEQEPDAPLAEHAEAEPTWVEEEAASHLETSPTVETPSEVPWPEHAPAELPAPDEPTTEKPAEPAAERPLRDRIPSVLPAELEAIKTPLVVPVFEPPRPPEATLPIRAPETALAASAAAAATVPRHADAIDETAPSWPSVRDITPVLRRALRLAALALGALACLVLVLIVLYRWVNPPTSTLMLGQRLAGTRIDQRWVPLNRISPYLQRAVITSEDGQFCRHHGVDWGEIEEAIERARDGIPRGGSTISMQVVKNLFLWPSKSYVRKALEFPLTFAIELAWSKPRILEIYLNIAEWGPGVFGAEAAARYHFGKSAATLTPSQAALLAVSLPNPIERRAGAPGPGTQRLANTIHARMMASPGNASCVQARR